jgi:hypothetical protein
MKENHHIYARIDLNHIKKLETYTGSFLVNTKNLFFNRGTNSDDSFSTIDDSTSFAFWVFF